MAETVKTRVALVIVSGTATALVGGYSVVRVDRRSYSPRESNQPQRLGAFVFRAWVPVPPSGPREGYWGDRLGAKIPHANLGWHERKLSIPGLVEIEDRGFQHYKSASANKAHVIILGGSVAFGAYASQIPKTYFNVIGIELERRGLPSNLTIIAAGAWKSVQELAALRLYGQVLKPDLVIFLNGLNDLTNGATSQTLYNQPVKTADGSEWTPLYHTNDYEQRVADYLENMRLAADLAAS